MFCPPGYLNWYEMRALTHEWASRVYLADAYETLGENPNIALREDLNLSNAIRTLSEHKFARTKLSLKDTNFEIELISFWIMNQLDNEYGASICSPAGNLLRTTHPIFFHPDQFFYFSLSLPLRKMAELFQIYEEYDAKRMTANDLWDRYTCLDGETGLIKQKVQTKRHFSMNFGDMLDRNDDGGVFENFVEPFLGWYVVWDKDLFPDTLYEFYESINLLNNHWSHSANESSTKQLRKKRGPKPSPAKLEFYKRYPAGIPENLSSEAIAAELTADGFPITGRSILTYDKERNNKK